MPGSGEHDVVIIGAGIAGASLAYFLAERGVRDVVLLEREAQLAVHSTGRSAATLSELDAHPTLLDLKVRSAPFFHAPPPGFSANPLLRKTGVMTLLSDALWGATSTLVDWWKERGLVCQLLSPTAARAVVSVLETTEFAGAVFVPGDGRLDVHEILTSYLRRARAAGATLVLGADVTGVDVAGGRCRGVRTRDREYRARVTVDAAGAWA